MSKRKFWFISFLIIIVNCCFPVDEAKANSSPIWIKVDLWKRRLNVMQNNSILDSYLVGVGKEQTPTPIGKWKIIEKSKGWGGGFGTHWLGLNVPWGKYGIHGTNRPMSVGRDVSHGCVRMLNTDIKQLYSKVPVGTIVYIEGPILGHDEWQLKKLVRGDRGTLVMLVQNRLQAAGLYSGNIDGIFGLNLEDAIKKYQKAEQLLVTGQLQQDEYIHLGIVE
ncbi:L,D-transpeptidase family protein [Thermoflavimicrobium daqui]|uniref:L,D-TPase catalytic domain-containing protein n=1 Tax=Thermoflavimicrobium daqui TaxID=2137476 RepID=A0A364K3U5_9BACL|nr:L,D-transpeptidase family protein [Thermoflavimicrobium daqui]RAL24035.1 hypothetical protein DL897_10040 [Thermoflavimicrobium daqui]